MTYCKGREMGPLTRLGWLVLLVSGLAATAYGPGPAPDAGLIGA